MVLKLLNLSAAIGFTIWPLFECNLPVHNGFSAEQVKQYRLLICRNLDKSTTRTEPSHEDWGNSTVVAEPESKRKRIFSQFDGGKMGLDELKGAVNNQLKKMNLFDRELLIACQRSDPELFSKRCLGTGLVLRDLAEVAVHIGAAVPSSVGVPLAEYIVSEEPFF